MKLRQKPQPKKNEKPKVENPIWSVVHDLTTDSAKKQLNDLKLRFDNLAQMPSAEKASAEPPKKIVIKPGQSHSLTPNTKT